MAYIHGLIIYSVAIPAEDNVNPRALQHECAIVHEYAKMKPWSFTKHLQAILTTFYEDIKSKPGASGCPKPKILTRKLAVEEVDMTPEDNCGGLTQEVVAATSADIVYDTNKDCATAPAPEPAAAVAPAALQRLEEGVTARLGRAQYQLN